MSRSVRKGKVNMATAQRVPNQEESTSRQERGLISALTVVASPIRQSMDPASAARVRSFLESAESNYGSVRLRRPVKKSFARKG